jgi:hypothetical protein
VRERPLALPAPSLAGARESFARWAAVRPAAAAASGPAPFLGLPASGGRAGLDAMEGRGERDPAAFTFALPVRGAGSVGIVAEAPRALCAYAHLGRMGT